MNDNLRYFISGICATVIVFLLLDYMEARKSGKSVFGLIEPCNCKKGHSCSCSQREQVQQNVQYTTNSYLNKILSNRVN